MNRHNVPGFSGLLKQFGLVDIQDIPNGGVLVEDVKGGKYTVKIIRNHGQEGFLFYRWLCECGGQYCRHIGACKEMPCADALFVSAR